MKANELMIGDWVYDTILKGNTRVEIISLFGIKGDFHENVYNENTFEPIPITPEILERNGFEKKSAYQWKYRDNSCTIEISIAPKIEIDGELLGPPPITVKIEGALFILNKTDDWYIHELQHAFRLFKLEKEIIL